MTHKKSKTVIASAVSLALASMMLAGGAYAGVIRNTNPTPGAPLGSCGPTQAATQGCVGAMDLTNVETKIYKADGTELGSFNKTTGDYPVMGLADYFVSLVMSGTSVVAKLGGKVWPVGEPMAVKSVVGDMKTSNGKPNNCIINTAYISADKNLPSLISGFLDMPDPIPVICSSDFQTHKRFKIPMQPASLDPANTPIDLVFDVVNESVWANADGLPGNTVTNPLNPTNLRPYQVFSKINNYTDKRLAGFKVIVGTGTGTAFKSASALGIEDRLQISLGLNEAAKVTTAPGGAKTFAYTDENIFDDEGGMATFSHGLFGPPDKHFSVNGFFDKRTAGFDAVQGCDDDPAMTTKCQLYPNPYTPVDMTAVPSGVLTPLRAADMIYSTAELVSNYVGPVDPVGTVGLPFGKWLPFGWHPKGIFWDFDNDPTTDADLLAWWNGSQWLKNYDSGFTPATTAELTAWGSDKSCGTASTPYSCYAIDDIEDTVNLGINYILKVGDGITGNKITVRIIPIVAADQTVPAYVSTPPAALPTTPTTPTEPTTPTPTVPVVSSSSGGGGGCAIGNDGRFDPTLPAMLFAGLGFLGWRRYKAGK